ncbi:apicomplexan specific [Cryptosporidium bovis]|uniref:apicomplexan specific n=1 Tax=Cryptosporidium bovis TaxID=310047 RepID=UPI00351A8769|nr:apicomplexan specific [Cryptosporidium bovis]
MEPSIKKEIEISNEEILKHIKEIVKPENLDTLTARKVRGELEKSLNLPNDFLLHKKTEINNMLDDFISKIDGENSTKVYSNTHEYFDGPINSKVDPDYKSFQNKVQNDKISTKRKQESMMSIDEFLEKAKIINLEIEGSGTKIPITPRKFSTGSVGWHFGNKIPLPVGNDTEW